MVLRKIPKVVFIWECNSDTFDTWLMLQWFEDNFPNQPHFNFCSNVSVWHRHVYKRQGEILHKILKQDLGCVVHQFPCMNNIKVNSQSYYLNRFKKSDQKAFVVCFIYTSNRIWHDWREWECNFIESDWKNVNCHVWIWIASQRRPDWY